MFQVCAPLSEQVLSLPLPLPTSSQSGHQPQGLQSRTQGLSTFAVQINHFTVAHLNVLSSSNREQASSPLLQLSSQAAFSSFLFLCYLPVFLPELLAQFLLYNLPKNPPEAPRSPGSGATQRDGQHEGQRDASLLGPDTQSCSEARNSHHPLH